MTNGHGPSAMCIANSSTLRVLKTQEHGVRSTSGWQGQLQVRITLQFELASACPKLPATDRGLTYLQSKGAPVQYGSSHHEHASVFES